MVEDELYIRLGLTRSATDKEIKAAYRRLAKTCHPDLFPDDADKRAEFDAIAEAKYILLDPEARADYDATGNVDKSGIESIMNDALTNIVGAFMSIVDNHPNPESVDLIALVRRVVPNARQQIDAAHAKHSKMKARYEAVNGRLKKEKGANLLGKALVDSLKKCDIAMNACTREYKVLDRMSELLEDYSFDYINETANGRFVIGSAAWMPTGSNGW